MSSGIGSFGAACSAFWRQEAVWTAFQSETAWHLVGANHPHEGELRENGRQQVRQRQVAVLGDVADQADEVL